MNVELFNWGRIFFGYAVETNIFKDDEDVEKLRFKKLRSVPQVKKIVKLRVLVPRCFAD